MKMNIFKLGRMLNKLNCVIHVDLSLHSCKVEYVRYVAGSDPQFEKVQLPIYGNMTIHDNGNIDYNDGVNYCNDVLPTHPIRHLLDRFYTKTVANEHKYPDNLTFGKALEYMKKGYRIARKNWSGYWYLDKYFFSPLNSKTSMMIVAHCKDRSYAPAMAYQCDMLADDWQVLGKENTDEEN